MNVNQSIEEMLKFGATFQEACKAKAVWEFLQPCIKIDKWGRVDTQHGTKTPLGLYRTIKDIMKKEME